MIHPSLQYVHDYRPTPRAQLVIGDVFKVFAIGLSSLVIAFSLVLIINNFINLQFIQGFNITEAKIPLWIALTPELAIISTILLASATAFYLNNRMAYSGYGLGVVLLLLLLVGVMSGLVLLLNSVGSFRLAMRNLETNVQKPLPSQGFFGSVFNECNDKGYYPGWVESMDESTITVNQWGQSNTFAIPSHERASLIVGERVMVMRQCEESSCRYAFEKI